MLKKLRKLWYIPAVIFCIIGGFFFILAEFFGGVFWFFIDLAEKEDEPPGKSVQDQVLEEYWDERYKSRKDYENGEK